MKAPTLLKLLHYFPTTRLTEGGTVRVAIDICTVLANRGHDVFWLTCDDTDVPESWKNGEPNTPSVICLGQFEKSGKRLTAEQLAVASKAIKNVEVVHVHAMWDPSNPQIAKICDSIGTPWVLSIHGMLDDWCMTQRGSKKKFYLATVGRRMVRTAAVFHTTAEEENRQASRWFKHNKVAIVPCIVDLEPYKNVPSPQEAFDVYGKSDAPTVLFLSRVHEKKSIETLIDAIAIVKQRGSSIRLFIAGTGDEAYIKTLEERAKSAGVADETSFLGLVVGSLKLSLYAMADVFALPTQQENFGLVYPEAMLCETPAIGTRGTDIWKELQEGGAVIADRTPEAFANAIETLVNDKEALDTKGKKGREHILQWLNTDTVAKGYEDMYKLALN
ncbi:MAG: glycosyltransferase [Phycisphaerae bacterium]|nr:glycosyltransferase [Phycisphaerae bacterium]